MKALYKRIPPEEAAAPGWSTRSARWYFEPAGRHFKLIQAQIAFDASPVATVLCDLAGTIVQANRAFLKLFGLPSEPSAVNVDVVSACGQVVPLRFIDALAREGELHQEELRANLATGESLSVLCTAIRLDGEEGMPRWLLITFDALRDPTLGGKRDSVEMYWPDVQSFFGVGHWRMQVNAGSDVADGALEWSAGMFDLLGVRRTRGRVTLKRWLSLVAPADRALVVKSLRVAAAEGGEFEIQYRRYDEYGHAQCIRSRGRRMATGSKDTWVLIGLEQRWEEIQYAVHDGLNKSVLQAVVDSSECPVYAIDRNFRLICSNGAFRTTLGRGLLSPTASIEDLCARLVDATHRQRVAENLRRALRGERRAAEAQVISEDGSSLWYDFTYNPVRSEGDEVLGVVVFAVDVTARRQAEQRTAGVRKV